MKGFVISLSLSALLGSYCWAQESTSNISMPTGEITNATQPAATLSTGLPPASSSWKMTLGSENFTYENDLRNEGPVISYNFAGARYNFSKEWEVELRQQFQFTSTQTGLGSRIAKMHDGSSVAMAETVLRGAYKPAGLWGSSVALFEARYYAPTDRASQENNELGRLRGDMWLEWIQNSRFTVAGWVSPRVLFNSANNPNTSVGADAEYYQIKAAPYFIYTMNDHIMPYYAYNLVESSSQAQRGNWEPDLANIGAHEIGLNLYFGSFFINPSIISETNLENADGSILTPDSRVYSYENISYNLNVYAIF